jgi:hypothetical protein
MFFRKHHTEQPMPEEFSDVIARLEDERAAATPLELDQIKTRAMSRAQRRATRPTVRGAHMRRTLVIAIATASLMVGGTGAVIAGGGDKSNGDDNKGNDQGDQNAGKKQYSHCKKSNPQPNCVPKTCKKSQNPQTDNCTPKHSGNGSHHSHNNGGSHGGDHHNGSHGSN